MLGEMTTIDAIAEPVRLALVRHLERHRSATLLELAGAADVHPNTVRAHVAALERAGVVERDDVRAAAGLGRPPVRYRLRAGWTAAGSGFRGLAELLAAAVGEAGVEPPVLRRLGRDWGRYLAGRPRGAPGPALHRVLGELGFDAVLEGERVHLRSCPCALVAPERPQVVCELAVGAAEGVLSGCGGDVRAQARRHDPHCRICEVDLLPSDIHTEGNP
jgi:predicted ArsR family transcriptional regulator